MQPRIQGWALYHAHAFSFVQGAVRAAARGRAAKAARARAGSRWETGWIL